MEDSAILEKIRGYIELKMFEEASRGIESLTAETRGTAEVQELRIIIMLDREQLGEALELCKNLCDLYPDNHAGYIQGAYTLHRMGETGAAIELIQSGPDSLREEPVYFYNLACYELALGKPDVAMTWLEQSFAMDPPSRAKSLEDPDLLPLRERITDWINNA